MKTLDTLCGSILLAFSAPLIAGCEDADGTISASETERIPNAYVGAVDDRLFIAVAPANPEASGEQTDVTAYLCDSDEVGIWINGEMTENEATLATEAAHVELAMEGEHLSGFVVVGEREPTPFMAVPAVGHAGLYRKEEITDEGIAVGGWIVLDDGRQRGLDGKGNDVTLVF